MQHKGEAGKLIVKGVPLKRFSKGGGIQEDIRLWALDQKRRTPSKAKPPEPPEKPPWQQFMDLNVNAMKWVVGNLIWTGLFGRRCQPAEAGQVEQKRRYQTPLELRINYGAISPNTTAD